MSLLLQTLVLCIAYVVTFATEDCVELSSGAVYNTRLIVCKLNRVCGLYSPSAFTPNLVDIYEEKNGKSELLASCSSESDIFLSPKVKAIVDDANANCQWDSTLSFGLIVPKENYDDLRYKCIIEGKERNQYKVFENTYKDTGKPMGTTKNGEYAPDEHVYTTRDPKVKSDYTTRWPVYPTEKPVYTTGKPTYPRDKLVYTTGKPAYPKEKPVYTTGKPRYPTEKPFYTTRQPKYPTEKPVFPARQQMYSTERPFNETKQPMYPAVNPVYTTRQPVYATEKPFYTTIKPVYPTEKSGYTTRDSMHLTEKPVYTKRKPMYPTEKPVYTTRQPKNLTEKPVYTTSGMDYLSDNEDNFLPTVPDDSGKINTSEKTGVIPDGGVNEDLKMFRENIIGLFFYEPATFGNKKYYLSRELFTNDVKNEEHCSMIVGGYLAEVDDAQEYDTVANYIREQRVSGAIIGGTNEDNANVWTFRRSGREVPYFRWRDGEPNNYNGNEHCLTIWTDFNDLMNDTPCGGNEISYHFVCETDTFLPPVPDDNGQIHRFNEDLKKYRENIIGHFFYEPATFGNKKYHLSRELFTNDVKNEKLCSGMAGGYLAEVDDAQEYDAVAKYIREQKVSGAIIGGTNEDNVNVWKFRRSGREVPYFRWRDGEPNNYNGNEHCLAIWTDFNDLMNDTPCGGSEITYHFICETDM